MRPLAGVPADRAVAITDGMTLAVGDYELQFFDTPNIHWPETMMTYEKKTGASCFPATHSAPTANLRTMQSLMISSPRKTHAFFENEALRYYANIVSTFFPPLSSRGWPSCPALMLKSSARPTGSSGGTTPG